MNSQQQKKQQEMNYYKCSECNDTGWIYDTVSNTAIVCKCVKKEISIVQFKKAGINIEDKDKSFNTFKTWNDTSKDLKNTGISYYTNFEKIKNDRKNSILLCGNPGSGKTHILLALANNFISNREIKVIYMNYREAITNFKQNYLDKEAYYKEISKYQFAELLLIDDLFKGKITETDINIMFEIINYRYINRLPIMISTEYKIENLLGIDEGTSSRIYEMCKDYLVEIIGIENNYRLKEN